MSTIIVLARKDYKTRHNNVVMHQLLTNRIEALKETKVYCGYTTASIHKSTYGKLYR